MIDGDSRPRTDMEIYIGRWIGKMGDEKWMNLEKYWNK